MTFSKELACDWSIQIPLNDLVALRELPSRTQELEKTVTQLRRELEALRQINSDVMLRLAELQREMRKR